MSKLTPKEQGTFESAARNVSRRIVSKCKSDQPFTLESCVTSRILGIEYLNDIIRDLPEDHKYKEDEDFIYDTIEIMKKEALSYIR